MTFIHQLAPIPGGFGDCHGPREMTHKVVKYICFKRLSELVQPSNISFRALPIRKKELVKTTLGLTSVSHV